MIYIGIDTGTHTGIAVWDGRHFLEVLTLPIHRAMALVMDYQDKYKDELLVIFEDARKRKWYGTGNTYAKLQGAGSIKRDAAIWEDFLTDWKIQFKAIEPIKGATKLSADRFKAITHYTGKTTEHSRDAAMMVFGRNGQNKN